MARVDSSPAALPTPATSKKAVAIATESLRACGIVLHSTAGTLVSTRKKTVGGTTAAVTEAMRLVRAAEGLLRQATSVLVEVATNQAVPVQTLGGNSGMVDVASSSSKSARRRRNRASKKNASPADGLATDVDGSGMDGLDGAGVACSVVAAAAPAADPSAASGTPTRILGPKTSRERSPRGARASSSDSGPHQPMFSVGQVVVIDGLVGRADLNGQIGKVSGYDLGSRRFMVVPPSGEAAVKVRAENLRLSIFNSA